MYRRHEQQERNYRFVTVHTSTDSGDAYSMVLHLIIGLQLYGLAFDNRTSRLPILLVLIWLET